MMNNELRPYDNYKSIDLPWLNSIPEHWSVSRNKNMMSQAKSLVGGNHHNYKLLSLTLNGVIARDMVNPKGKFPKEFDTYQIVRQKDLVFCLFDIDETPRTVGISPFEGMITGAYTVFNVKNANERYLYYYYLALDNNKMLKPLYTGLRKVVSADTFLRTKLPVPPRSEQDQIVKYLDHQLAKINKFIKTKKKLIAVLKEQKQAIINEAVTKGLDTSVKMKSSGIKWIGDVPEHWKVTPLKRILEVKMTDGPHETPTFLDYGIPFVSADAVQDGKLHLKRMRGYISQEDHKKYCEKIKPQINDIFIVKSGSTTGKSCIVDFEEEFSVWSPLALVRTKQEFEPYFVFNAICSTYFQKQVENKWSFGTQPNIGMGVLQNLIITIPDYTEQIVIAKTIRERTTGIDGAIKKINDEIDFINEYKNSLISDVVTGKVDVRNIVIDGNEEEIIEDTELDEDTIDDESLEAEDGDE